MSKRKHEETTTTSSSSQDSPQIFESSPIHDRSSTFIAIFSPSTTFPRSLQRHQPFETAMHRMLAWRKLSAQRSLTGSFSASNSTADSSSGRAQNVICETGSDEDGEKYAGKKLEKVLSDMNVVGTVVVARWYGGVLLGPVRFKWIEDSAREAILIWKRSVGAEVPVGGNADGAGVKKVKVDGGGGGTVDDEKDKERLVKLLKERDGSVSVLRGLLAEKNAELKRLEEDKEEDAKGSDGLDEQKEQVSSPVTTVPDYASMPVTRLKQLEKARDATLSWILKQIDAVEEKIKNKEKANDGS